MFDEKKIRDMLYVYYNDLVPAVRKSKNVIFDASKIDNALLFIEDNIDNFNTEELKFVNNMLLLLKYIVKQRKSYRLTSKAQKDWIQKIKSKLKEPNY